MELISREEMLQKIREMPIEYFGRSLTRKSVIMGELEELPTIESRPKGKWIKRHSYDRRDNFYACSECGRIINIICGAHLEDYPFCHCGADMRGSEE